MSEAKGWQVWLQNGRVSSVVWGVTFITYVTCLILHITDSGLTNAFVTITGVWVANLGIASSKKKAEDTARVEQKVEHAVTVAEVAKETVELATGSMAPIIEDKTTGELRAQKPPRIARGDSNG